jgi:DNA repair exonuclease SbcCD ATPase subunit
MTLNIFNRKKEVAIPTQEYRESNADQLKEIAKQKKQIEQQARQLEEQAVMLRCPDRRCRADGCNNIGTHVIVAIENPMDNIEMELNDRFPRMSGSDSYHISIRSRKNRYGTAGARQVFKPLMFLCSDHVDEQIQLSGGEAHMQELRDKVLARQD